MATKRNHTTNDDASKGNEMTGEEFEALPAAEKEQIWQEIDRSVTGKTLKQLRAESRPLDTAERARWERAKNKGRRPRIGKGAKVIALSVERGLLARADKYARRMGVSRAQLVALGLELAMQTTRGAQRSREE